MEFLTTKGIAFEIENIIRKAKEYIYIITPYEKIDNIFYKRLVVAQERKIEIIFIYRKRENNDSEKEKFIELNKINLYCHDNLHAKCYLNEKTAIITSMNLYEFSEKNNCEMGIKINKSENEDIFEEILEEAKTIKQFSEKLQFEPETDKEKFISDTEEKLENGFCIRCKKEIAFNSSRPLCNLCYRTWKDFSNEEYLEHYCHKCGKEFENISFKHCFCNDCNAHGEA